MPLFLKGKTILIFCFWAITLPGTAAQSLSTWKASTGDKTAGTVKDEADPADGMLTIYVYPSSDPINYQSPGLALWSIIRMELKRLLFSRNKLHFTNNRGDEASLKLPYRSSIGHTIACISCNLPDGTNYLNWVSMSSYHYTDTAIQLLIKDKVGIGFLFHKFSDGVLIRDKENILRLVNYYGNRTYGDQGDAKRVQPRYMSFPIAASQCAAIKDMVDFYETFPQHDSKKKESNGQSTLYFTNMLDPFDSYLMRRQTGKGDVGGGCAPFGVGLLKAGGQHLSVYDKIWQRHFNVSEKLIGNQNRPVSVITLLLGSAGQKWVHSGYPEQQLDVYDPEFIWEFIGILHDSFNLKDIENQNISNVTEIKQFLKREGIEIKVGEEITLFTPFSPLLSGGKRAHRLKKQTGIQEKSIQGIIISKTSPTHK